MSLVIITAVTDYIKTIVKNDIKVDVTQQIQHFVLVQKGIVKEHIMVIVFLLYRPSLFE